MTPKEKRTLALVKLRKMRIWMILAYGLTIIIALIVVAVFSVKKNEKVLKNEVSSLASSLNVQLKLNLENYLSRMESVATMAFAVDNAYTYDATNTTLSEYDVINLEKAVSDELFRLCLMENFVDYGIVYRNNHTVGKVSNGTTSLFGNDMFLDLQAMISREHTHDGWYTGYKNNYDRVYYVKQIHDNALLVLSFYTTELEYVFDNPETMRDMTIRLTDKNYKMIYSSEDDTPGNPLPSEIVTQARTSNDAAVLDDSYLITVNTFYDNWHVVCSIPTDVILAEEADNRKAIRIVTIIAAIVGVLLGTVFSFMLSDPISMIAYNLDDKKEG